MQVTITVMYIQVIYFNNLLALSIGYKFGEYYFREYNSRCTANSYPVFDQEHIFKRLNTKFLIHGGQSCNKVSQFKEKNS